MLENCVPYSSHCGCVWNLNFERPFLKRKWRLITFISHETRRVTGTEQLKLNLCKKNYSNFVKLYFNRD